MAPHTRAIDGKYNNRNNKNTIIKRSSKIYETSKLGK